MPQTARPFGFIQTYTLFLFYLIAFSLTNSAVKAQDTRLDRRLALLSRAELPSNTPVSVLIHGHPTLVAEHIGIIGGRVKFSTGQITSATVPVERLTALSACEGVWRIEAGEIGLEPMNDRMRINNRIQLVHQGITPLPQPYDGRDVVMGIIDTGIDFTHPDFLDSTGQTRVEWVWDHLLADSTNTPAVYGYGQEFSKADIVAGIAGAHIDQTAHGTHVAGIAAAGGDTSYLYRGAAPSSKIIAVSLDFSLSNDIWLSSIADAVHYIFSKADSMGLPCVVNISAGTYFGSHDGMDLAAQVIDNLIAAQPGRMVVAAAGNAGGYPIHLHHQPTNDSLFTWLRSTNGAPIYIECWGDSLDFSSISLAISADSPAPLYSSRATTTWTPVNQLLGQVVIDTLWSMAGDRIAIVQTYRELVAGRYAFTCAIIPDSTTYLFRLNSAGTGSFDAWSFEMVYNNLPSPSIYPAIAHYITPDVQQNICSSFQCGQHVICTGQYVNRNNYIDVNGNTQSFPTIVGALATSSSRGPTRDGRTKPDITSTGEVTMAALRLSSVAWFIQNQPYKLAQDSIHIRDGGTSSAAPAVAGTVALLLQSQPTITHTDIRNRVLLCAKTDVFTGNNLPDNAWGHGKLDALNVLTGCSILSITNPFTSTSSPARLSPNPSSGITSLEFEKPLKNAVIRILDSVGKTIEVIRTESEMRVQLNLEHEAGGLYFIQIENIDSVFPVLPLVINHY